METPLYETYQLIELHETQINGAWKGLHLLLFFLSFVFGSCCTFCFHVLMYFFEDKCVLYPRLLSLSPVKQALIKDALPYDSEEIDSLPVDFVSTQWVEQSVCYLPTYVPLVSGICGLVWTTLFLMCSTGSRVFTGLEQSWRILPPVFLFSLVMGAACVYTSAVTTAGLHELCGELALITGDHACSFAVNVVTLAHGRRICGVYLTIELTVLSAWLHTLCWLLSALLTAARVLLAVDFQLVRISAHLRGNIDLILEEHERQVGDTGYSPGRHHWSPHDLTLRVDPAEAESYMRTVPREQRFIVRDVINVVSNAVTLAELMRGKRSKDQTTAFTETDEAAEPVILRAIKTYDDDEMDMSVYIPIKSKEDMESNSEDSVLSAKDRVSDNGKQRKQKND